MSEFRGLHNPERHKPFTDQYAECLPDLGGCLSECGDGDPCRCCSAAEVERLTAELADRDRRIEEALEILDDPRMGMLDRVPSKVLGDAAHGSLMPSANDVCHLARAEAAEAAIQRVRDEIANWPSGLDATLDACAAAVFSALDGGESDE